MFSKRKEVEKSEKMTPEEYVRYLQDNDMDPSDESISAASDPEENAMSEEEYEQFLIDNEMKPLGYVEED